MSDTTRSGANQALLIHSEHDGGAPNVSRRLADQINRMGRAMNGSARRRAVQEYRRSGRAPPAFRDWLAAQLKNPPDERLRPAIQAAWDEMEAARWRMPDTWEG
jgi:hypothetical protein